MADLTPAWLHWLADALRYSAYFASAELRELMRELVMDDSDLASAELTELIIDDSDPAGPVQTWQLTWQLLQPGTMIIYKSRVARSIGPYLALPESLGLLWALTNHRLPIERKAEA